MKFNTHKDLKTPHGATIIWRYMSLDKFLDLLANRQLFFTNAAHFTDGYEISLPKNILELKRTEFTKLGLDGRDLEEELAIFRFNHQPMKDSTLVNSWSMGRIESFALWKIYLGGSKSGVAIRTSYSKLKKSIVEAKNTFPENIYAGIVDYKDRLSIKDISRFKLITTKRAFYEYERELRLFIAHYPKSEGGEKTPYKSGIGRNISVDLDILVDEIYISPFTDSWFEKPIKEVISKVAPSLKNRIRNSSIQDE